MSPDLKRTFTVAGLERVTGVPKRTYQFQTNSGALIPLPETLGEGRGVRRQYAIPEACIAAVLGEIVDVPFGINELCRVSSVLRALFDQRKLESPADAEQRSRKALAKYGYSVERILRPGAKGYSDVSRARAWEAFVRALHGVEGMNFELIRDRNRKWSVNMWSGIPIFPSTEAGTAKLTWGLKTDDAAELFEGILE